MNPLLDPALMERIPVSERALPASTYALLNQAARSYGAQCTPDFFGFNARDELQYRGRLDAGRTSSVPHGRRELYEAMRQVAETGNGPAEQAASMGCSIKWRS